MTLFCQYEYGVFPTPERWSEFGPRTEAKLIRRRLRSRRFERWDREGSGEYGYMRVVAQSIEEDDFMEWAYTHPHEWLVRNSA